MVSIQNLSKSYGDLGVLLAINLDLEAGQVYGIVGRNGAGKTTLFDCLAGVNSYSGEVKYAGESLKNITGYLSTRPYMMTYITGLEYLQLLANARGIPLPTTNEINLFDLPLDRYASSYSTGMQKKLALTGLLFLKNEFYLMDEPYNGLDLESNTMLAAIIARLKELGKTILISSHILATLTQSCDIIYHLDEGVIAGTYTPDSYHDLENLFKETSNLEQIKEMKF